jgi:beta-lactamase class A
VVARAPSGATAADVLVDGRPAGPATLRGGRARARLAAAPGAHHLEVRFRAGARALGSVAASGVRLLPAGAAAAVPGRRTDPELGSRLGRLLRGFDGQAGAWVQDLASGRTAESNATARFPAASTVKLALLIGALARLGPGPSPLRADLRAMAVWSSNLATNRVLERLGGSERGGARLAQEVLLGLGARSSTFTGGYIVGTELQPGLPAGSAPDPPPAVSGRVTTARDLARLLYAIHAAAAGVPQARRETGLTVRSARLALGWLLASEQRGDNASLVAGGLPPGTPVAQKNGWLRAARHAAALVYGPSGPRIVVLLAYRDGGLTRAAATRLGGRLARLGTA